MKQYLMGNLNATGVVSWSSSRHRQKTVLMTQNSHAILRVLRKLKRQKKQNIDVGLGYPMSSK